MHTVYVYSSYLVKIGNLAFVPLCVERLSYSQALILLVFIAVHAYLPSKCIIIFDNVCVDFTSTSVTITTLEPTCVHIFDVKFHMVQVCPQQHHSNLAFVINITGTVSIMDRPLVYRYGHIKKTQHSADCYVNAKRGIHASTILAASPSEDSVSDGYIT